MNLLSKHLFKSFLARRKKVIVILFISLLAAGYVTRSLLPLLIIDIKFAKKFGKQRHYSGSPADIGYPYTPLAVQTNDNLRLNAYLVPTSLPPKGTVITAHGIRAGAQQFFPKVAFLVAQGYNVVLLDLRAHGASEGNYCTFGYYEKSDIRCVVDSLQQKFPHLPIGIWGKSLGGAIAWQALAEDKRLQFGIIESTFSDYQTVVHDYNLRYTGINSPFFSRYLAQRAAIIARFPPDSVRPSACAKRVRQPVLVMHGTDDRHIRYEYGKLNFENAASPQKTFYTVKGAGHLNLWEVGGSSLDSTVTIFLHHYADKK